MCGWQIHERAEVCILKEALLSCPERTNGLGQRAEEITGDVDT
jgi:hypothetical protein